MNKNVRYLIVGLVFIGAISTALMVFCPTKQRVYYPPNGKEFQITPGGGKDKGELSETVIYVGTSSGPIYVRGGSVTWYYDRLPGQPEEAVAKCSCSKEPISIALHLLKSKDPMRK